MKNAEETIGKIIDKSNTSFIGYIDDNGFPITKAMLKPREREGIKTFWFSTNTSSNKVRYFRQNNKASIYFIDKRFFRGVSLVGTVEVLETPEAKIRIWQEGDTMYYKEGENMKKIINIGIATLGVILILLGFYYAAIKAGIPYQDPTPELLKRYNHDMNIGMAMFFTGLGVEAVECLYCVIIVICRVFKGKRKR